MGVVAIYRGQVTSNNHQIFISLYLKAFIQNLVQIGTLVSEKIQFEFLYVHNLVLVWTIFYVYPQCLSQFDWWKYFLLWGVPLTEEFITTTTPLQHTGNVNIRVAETWT